MTTPASLNTAYRAICLACIDAGQIAAGDNPSGELIAEYMGRLNDLINVWQTDGIRLWLQLDLSVPLVAGTGTYTIGSGGTINMTKPTRIIDDGYYIDANSNRRSLILISRDEYIRLSNVVNTGPINSYWPDKGQNLITVKFWMVPDATAALGTAHLTIQQQVTNFVSITDTMNFPPEWFMALRWGLADEICTGQPTAIVARCQQKAMFYKDKLDNWDVEDASTRFQPDQQGVLVNRTR